MNKLFKHFTYILSLAAVMLAAGCSDDIADEITSVDVSRLFSPTAVEATISNQTGVKIKWKAVNKATNYNVEVYDNGDMNFSGTPIRTANVTYDELPCTFTGFDGETTYSLRIQAIGTGISDSKWTETTFKTNPEQIFYAVNSKDITRESAILRWPAGEVATNITLTPSESELAVMPDVVVYTITADDIAAGAANITGLALGTKYEAKMKNGAKTRGTVTFSTKGLTIPVKAGDNLEEILANAEEGNKFSVEAGTYGTGVKFTIKENITILAEDANKKPNIKGYFSLEDGASLSLQNVILDGTGTDSQAFVFATDNQTYGKLTLEGCEISNMTKGLYYLNSVSLVETITINNCLIHDIVCNGGDFLDSRKGAFKTLTLSNSTVYNSCAARDFIRYDNSASSFPDVSSVINVSNCTLVGVSAGASNRLLYVRFANHTINLSKNVIANSAGIFTNQAATATPTFNGNNYFTAPGYLSGTTGLFFDASGTQLDPKFKDASKGDFTVGNDDMKDKKIGDPRWIK